MDSPIETTGTYTRDRDRHRLDAAVCRQRILEYNRERYRGFGTNVEIDERANGLFASGVAATREDLTAQVLFVGEVYGGAQERFLADGYEAEARRITNGLIDGLDQYRHVLAGCRPLLTEIPSVEVLEQLLLPFHATKRWFVWGTKFLALSSPDTFPVVDSRVSTILGLGSSGNMGRRYHGAVQVIREVVEQNLNLLEELRVWDQGRCPSVLKVLDKVLYAEGGA